VYRKTHEDLVQFFKMERGLGACTDVDGLMQTFNINTLRTGSFKVFKRPFPGFLTDLTL